MLSSFSLDGEIVYCLGSYCSGCVKKETIQQTKMFSISFGKYTIVADDTVSENALRSTVRYNYLLLEYMYGIKEDLPKKDYAAIKSSVAMKGQNYHILAFADDQRVNCMLFNPDHITDAENLLVVGDLTGATTSNVAHYYPEMISQMSVCVAAERRPAIAYASLALVYSLSSYTMFGNPYARTINT